MRRPADNVGSMCQWHSMRIHLRWITAWSCNALLNTPFNWAPTFFCLIKPYLQSGGWSQLEIDVSWFITTTYSTFVNSSHITSYPTCPQFKQQKGYARTVKSLKTQKQIPPLQRSVYFLCSSGKHPWETAPHRRKSPTPGHSHRLTPSSGSHGRYLDMSKGRWEVEFDRWKQGRAQHWLMTSAGKKNTLLDTFTSPSVLFQLPAMSSR